MTDLLGNCSNKATYEYLEEDINKIFNRLEKELKNAKQRFVETNVLDKTFKL